MWFLALAQMGIQGGQAQGDKIRAETAQFVEDKNALAKNKMREANNQLSAANGSLARFTQSLSNRLKLKNAGKAIDVSTENIMRLQEQATGGDFERRIAAAEESGAWAAQRAASGTGGGTNQMMNATIDLRNARIQQEADRAFTAQDANLRAQRSAQIDGMVLGLDDVTLVDDIDMIPAYGRVIDIPSDTSIALGAAFSFASAYAQFGGSFGSTAGANLKVNTQAPIDGTRFSNANGMALA